MTHNLLENIRLLKDAVLSTDNLESMCESAGSLLKSTIIAAASGGEVLAANESDRRNIVIRTQCGTDDNIYVESSQLKNYMLRVYENITIFSDKNKKRAYVAMFLPLSVKDEKVGLIIAYREAENYNMEEIILLEYAALFAAQKINTTKILNRFEQQRKKGSAKSAVETLSITEREAAAFILKELQGSEGLVVASKIADNAGITRSVIVNALKKIESAGAIESRSLGMKGTYIKVVNDALYDFLFID